MVYKFCLEMIQKETFPRSFKDTTLHMIFKGGKGKRHNLSDNRFVHCKPWWPRLIEGLTVEEGLKQPLIEGSSVYQIGGQPGHRAEEHVFVLKSLIARQRAQGKALIIQPSDIRKYFDKEMIEDVFLTSLKRGANPKSIRIWYKLNEGTRIQVKTGVGTSQYTEVGAIVGQGTIGGALGSQAVLDNGVSEYFPPGSGDEVNYGTIAMAPLLFQDDIIHSTGGISAARKATVRIDKVVKKLNLKLHEDKTSCILLGSKKQQDSMKRELQVEPLFCGQIKVKVEDKIKWLGQILSSSGLAGSVAETVASREGKIRGACLEIAQVVNDWRSRAVGGLETALFLWESVCIPSLLHGSGTWTEISTETENRLNKIQFWYLRLVLQVGPGSPKASLLWDTKTLNCKFRVWEEKIRMILFIRGQGEETLSRKIYEEQKFQKWPGLVEETAKICYILGIEDVNLTKSDQNIYMKLVVEALHRKNEETLRGLATGKCERISGEIYEKKDYILYKNISLARQHYRTRFGMHAFAGNYSQDRRYARSNWLCLCQKSREEESHLKSGECTVYGDLTNKYSDLTSDENLADLFREVLARRDQLTKQANMPVGGQ